MIQKSDFEAWLHHEVTEEFFKYLQFQKEEFKESWARGGFTEQSVEGTAQRNAEAIGMVLVIQQILDMNYEGMAGDLYGE